MAKSLGHDYVVLDLYKGINKQLEYMQRDALTRIVEISLTFNGKRFSVEDSTVEFHVTRPTGLISYVDMEIVDAPNGIIKATLTNQMLNDPGKLKCEVIVRGLNNSKISFPIFHPIVKESTFADGTITSSDEFTKLEEALDKINGIGNPGDLTTNDKTIVGGINEIRNELHNHLLIPHITYRDVTVTNYVNVLETDKGEAIMTNDDKSIIPDLKTRNSETKSIESKNTVINGVKIKDLPTKKPINDDLLVIETQTGTGSTKVSELLDPVNIEINKIKKESIKYSKI